MTANCQKERINTLRRLNGRLKYMPVDHLASYARNQLLQPKTALITTEAMLGVVWNEFEKAMGEEPGLKFSHNLFSPEDTTIARRDSRLQVAAGMKHEYIRVVTDRVENLLSTGIWDFWIDFGSWREKSWKIDPYYVPDFVPLTLQHDGVYLLFVLTGILLALATITFAAALITVLVKMIWGCIDIRIKSLRSGGAREVKVILNGDVH